MRLQGEEIDRTHGVSYGVPDVDDGVPTMLGPRSAGGGRRLAKRASDGRRNGCE